MLIPANNLEQPAASTFTVEDMEMRKMIHNVVKKGLGLTLHISQCRPMT